MQGTGALRDKTLIKYIIAEAVLIALIILWAFFKVQMDDERYYNIFSFTNLPENFDPSGGVVNINGSMGLGSDSVVATMPAIHVQKGSYTLEIDHQGDVDIKVNVNNEGSVIAGFVLPKDELISYLRFEAPGDLYSMSVDFIYPGEGSFTLKHVYLRTDGVFYTDTVAAACFLIIALILLGLWAYKTRFHEKDDKEKLIVCGVIAFAVFINYPLYWSFTKNGGDMAYHLARVENLKNEIVSGQIPAYIYFIQNKYRGYLAALYPQTFLYIPAILRLAGVSLAIAWKYLIMFTNLATMWTSWYFAKKFFKRRDAALLFMALYTMLPYRIELIAYRNAIGELLSMVFMPLLFAALYDMIAGDRKNWTVLVIAMTGMINSHIISTVFSACFTAVVCVIFLFKIIREHRLFSFIKAAVWSAALNLWFIIPFLYYYRYSELSLTEHMGTMNFSESAVFPAQLFMMFAGKGAHSSNKVTLGIFNECSLALGTAGLLLLAMGLYFAVFKKDKDIREKAAVTALVLGMILMFMSVTWFPWETLQKIGPINRFVSQFQFPTRFRQFGEALICIPGCMAVFSYPYFFNKRKFIMTFLVCAAVFYFIFTFDSDLKADENYTDAFGAGVQEGNYRDYVPEGYSGSAFESNTSPAGIYDYRTGNSEVTFSYKADEDTYADIKRIYYAGYRAFLSDGTPLKVSKGDGGRLRVELKAGEGDVRVIYDPPVYFRLTFIFSMIALLFFVGLAISRKKRTEFAQG